MCIPVIVPLCEQIAAEREKENLEHDLRKFTEEYLPELQAAIDEIHQEIERRSAELDKLAAEMNRTGIRPNTDTDYWRWKCTIEDMKKDLANLLTERRDAYIALRKLELMADSGGAKQR